MSMPQRCNGEVGVMSWERAPQPSLMLYCKLTGFASFDYLFASLIAIGQ
jgi:hypothetical protein